MIKLDVNLAEAEKHFIIVKDLIQTRIRNILSSGIKRNKNKILLTKDLNNYINSLLSQNNLKSLITAPPHTLKGIVSLMAAKYPDFIDEDSDSNYILRNIFLSHCYNKPDFDKLEFIKRINIDTCPYCNRCYIYYLSKENEIKPQIDHFYPKTKYPFLGVSFYNLIPSCQTCNGFGAKEEKDPMDEELINPYLIDATSFKFSYKIKSINILSPLQDKNCIEIKFLNSIQSHLNVFKLNKLYEQHSDHALV